jgi:hypothetical protein
MAASEAKMRQALNTMEGVVSSARKNPTINRNEAQPGQYLVDTRRGIVYQADDVSGGGRALTIGGGVSAPLQLPIFDRDSNNRSRRITYRTLSDSDAARYIRASGDYTVAQNQRNRDFQEFVNG